MRTWNTPSVQDLDVRLTASQGNPSTTEAAGFMQNGWNDPTYDTSLYEKVSSDCFIPAKSTSES